MAVSLLRLCVLYGYRPPLCGTYKNGVAHRHEILGELYFWFPCVGCCSPALEEPIFRLCLVQPRWLIAFTKNES